MTSLPRLLIEPVVRQALLEDLGGAGDLTTAATVAADARATAHLVARDAGVIAGTDPALLAFHLLDPSLDITSHLADGTHVAAGDIIATVSGDARSILGAERVSLNLLSHLSGVASATAALVAAVAGTAARICCTRKTTPGLRALEKSAVVAGGGVNHRFGLDDAVLIKDNHIALAGGVRQAIERARAGTGHLVAIEVEVDTLDQLGEVLDLPVTAVLLDNFSITDLAEAVRVVDGRFVTEASGRLDVPSAAAVAATGVDLISSGAITHSAPILDIGLDIATPSHRP